MISPTRPWPRSSSSSPRGGSSDGRAIWAVAELADGAPTRLSLEVATLAARLAGAAGGEAATVLVAPGAAAAAAPLAEYGPPVLAVDAPSTEDRPGAAVVSARVAALARERAPAYLLCCASPDGKDVAGQLAALLDWPVLVNGASVRWQDGLPRRSR